LHERIRFVFIDEYHDLSPDQFRLLTAIVPGRKPERQLLAMADPNQAIYGFRGGDAAEMLRRFRAEYRPQEFSLRENFRSTGRLVETSNHFIAAGDAPANSAPVRPGTDTPHLHRLPTDVEEAVWVASAIQAAHAKGRAFQDIAVLYRTHQRATMLEHELLKVEVPVARIQANRFFDDRLVIEGFRYLQLIAALDDHRFEPAINWPRVLVDELTMMQLRTAARLHELRLAELAGRPDLLRATVTPLAALGIERFMGDLERGVGHVEHARAGVERILPLVRRRRDPIPLTERGNFRSTLRELAKVVDGVADTLVEIVQEGIAIRVDFDADDADHCLAAGMLKRTLEAGFGTVVLLNVDADQPSVPFSLVDLEMHAGQFTCTALVYRLCQRLDERFDRSRRQRFVVFDVEATSTHIPSAELLQIGAVVVENGRVVGEPFVTWVRPSSPDAISTEVQRITGIRWRDVADAPEPAVALAEFLAFVGDTPLVGHNIDAYDLPLIRRLCDELGQTPPSRFSIDTLKIRRRLHPGEPASLEALLTPEEKRTRRDHRADLDARLNARVFIDLMMEIGADRRVSSMGDELPLVAASVALKGRTDPDNQLLQIAGRRSLELGQGWLLDAGSTGWLPEVSIRAERALRAVELVTDPEDAHWQRIEQKWAAALDVFERTHREHDLQTFLRWFQLAVSTSIEHADENRVAMMTIHAAKGREWPVVFMLGSEDDQYVFSTDQDDAESRRMFYVGMTRAQDVLIVTHANRVNGRTRQPSRFLRDLLLPD
jgi:DNA polymerase III epsilon subunit-like protein